jgi:hypothetical protein
MLETRTFHAEARDFVYARLTFDDYIAMTDRVEKTPENASKRESFMTMAEAVHAAVRRVDEKVPLKDITGKVSFHEMVQLYSAVMEFTGIEPGKKEAEQGESAGP